MSCTIGALFLGRICLRSRLTQKGKRVSKTYRLVAIILLPLLVSCAAESTLIPGGETASPQPADGFDYPLDPGRYGPYVQGVTGPLDVDTRFGVQNPALGDAPKCFHDRNGEGVPFRELYHAGEDWFRLDAAGQVDAVAAAGDPVHAVAAGVVYLTQEIGSQGWILVLSHTMEDGTKVYSAYWHVSQLQVRRNEHVRRGQVVALVHDQGWNSHLHWEVRTFAHASNLFPSDSAGGRGTCNGRAAGVAYTWDDDPSRARPEHWGYFDPLAFIESHRP
jgi:murein DD-endopeptidase MepM/ murein hydrolase activator NlpD